MADLITLAQVREALGLATADTGGDAFLTNLIARASDFIRSYTRRQIEQQASFTDYYDGRPPWTARRNTVLKVKEFPINSVTSLHQSDDQTWDSSTLIASSDYLVDADKGRIHLINGLRFYDWPQSIRFVGNVGYVSIPARIQDACIQMVTMKWNRRGAEGIGSKSFGDGTVAYLSEDDLTKATRRILDDFRSDRC